MSFKVIKQTVITAWRAGTFQHEARQGIHVKNLLATGQASANSVEKILNNRASNHRETSPHDVDSRIDARGIKKDGWPSSSIF